MSAEIPGTVTAPMLIEGYPDPDTGTVSYLVLDARTHECAVIDSVMNLDLRSGRTCSANADKLVERVHQLGATTRWILETHVHADHLSAAPYLKLRLGGRVGIGAHVAAVRNRFDSLFNAKSHLAEGAGDFDHLFSDNEIFAIGKLKVIAMHTPGHTPACLTYLVEGAGQTVAFVGDTLFMPDQGTARCDFAGGDARTLFGSIGRLLRLPGETRLYTCHDYQSDGHEARFVSTVAEQRTFNIHVRDGISEDEFVSTRNARDATLALPLLLLPALQVNLRAGQLPALESNGIRFLRIPLDAL